MTTCNTTSSLQSCNVIQTISISIVFEHSCARCQLHKAWVRLINTLCTHTHIVYPGLAGSGDFENAEVFAVVDVVEDIWMKMIHFFFEKDEKRKVR